MWTETPSVCHLSDAAAEFCISGLTRSATTHAVPVAQAAQFGNASESGSVLPVVIGLVVFRACRKPGRPHFRVAFPESPVETVVHLDERYQRR
jgi:hypothetical protein